MHYGRLIRKLAALALRDPRRVPLLLATAWRFRARGWYRRAPFLPLPPADYVAWRLHTAYGDAVEPRADELARYVRWTADMKKPRRP
ncbi:MAG TPA: hypothetical protein VFZ24_05480 [Longimicrobiales bacterium]